MATTAGACSAHQEYLFISEEEFEQDQSALIRDLVAKITEVENKLSIMKDAKGKASTDNQGKFKPIDVKDIERPDKKDKQVAKFNIWFDKFKDLLASCNRVGELQRELGKVVGFDRKPRQGDDQEPEGFHEELSWMTPTTSPSNKSETLAQHLQSYLRTYMEGEPRA